MLADCAFGGRSGEAGPAGPRIEFCSGTEQLILAADTDVEAIALIVPVGASESAFSALLARHPVLFRGQLRAPFGVAQGQFLCLAHCAARVRFPCNANVLTLHLARSNGAGMAFPGAEIKAEAFGLLQLGAAQ